MNAGRKSALQAVSQLSDSGPYYSSVTCSILLLLGGDMRHGFLRCCAVPVLLVRWEPDHITGSNLLDRSALALYEATAARHDQDVA